MLLLLLKSLSVRDGTQRLLIAGQAETQRDGHVMRVSQMVGHTRIGRVSERSQSGCCGGVESGQSRVMVRTQRMMTDGQTGQRRWENG